MVSLELLTFVAASNLIPYAVLCLGSHSHQL